MRQVIRRFLKHLDAEKNASLSTIQSYRYDLTKFDDYLVSRLGRRFLPGDVSRDHVRDYLMWLSEVGHQKPNEPSARARALAAIRSFFKDAHQAGLLRDNPAADIPLPKISMGEIRALSHEECDRFLRIVATNPSQFRKVRDRAKIVTFLLTGARLREIVHLDKGHSESYEPQESCDNGSVSAFSKPRVGESGQRVKVVGRLECCVVQFIRQDTPRADIWIYRSAGSVCRAKRLTKHGLLTDIAAHFALLRFRVPE